jgi:hypothetical protein
VLAILSSMIWAQGAHVVRPLTVACSAVRAWRREASTA